MYKRQVKKAAADGSFDITGAEIIDPANYKGFDEMVAEMVELRKGKMTDEQCRAALSKGNYFGTMLVKQGKADCLDVYKRQALKKKPTKGVCAMPEKHIGKVVQVMEMCIRDSQKRRRKNISYIL